MSDLQFPSGANSGHRLRDQRGFTLLESIATIIIGGIIAMMIIPFFQSGITESHRPALWLQDAVALNRVMENVNVFYRALPTKNLPALQNLSLSVGAVNTSQNNSFGIYAVLENGFIRFNSTGNETAGGSRILKISIRSVSNPGYQLTQLFTVQ
ncbi:MAG: prepilin-type N-terminal cleavage/methylation domain-containing protein [Deltaproteobacteria bacterium]|nr:prepilin-type N-terminal cleavage/methylation domain-containing protein [Deltaproteobacteria bacterium]